MRRRFSGLRNSKRPHVVQAIGKFDQHHAHIIDHREQHLPHILGLLLFPRDTAYVRDFCEAFNQMSDLFTKVVANGFRIGERILDNVVQQTGRDGHDIHAHIREDISHFQRMNEVGFARRALLTFVLAGREKIGAPQQIKIRLRMVTPYLLNDFFDANHKKLKTSVVRCQWSVELKEEGN